MKDKNKKEIASLVEEVKASASGFVTNNLGILSYDLTDSIQRDNFLCAIKGARLKSTIDEMYDNLFRPTLKYGNSLINEGTEVSDEEREIIEAVWDKIHEYLRDSGSNFDLENS